MGIPVFEKFRENGNFCIFCKNCGRTDEKHIYSLKFREKFAFSHC